MKKSWNVAVVGATGVVGQAMLSILEERGFPVGNLRPLASARSAGKIVTFRGKPVAVETLARDSFSGIDIALFSAGAAVSKEFAPIAAETGAVVIDNTSHFRMEKDVPLVVPEVNKHRIPYCKKRRILSNPNCSTIQLVVVLNALHQKAKIRRVTVATYQSVSGAGRQAMEDLKAEKHPATFNCVPHIDRFLEDGTTKEEWKMMAETAKIMETDIPMSVTCVRVPVFVGHSEAVQVEFDSAMTPDEARTILRETPGVEVVDDPSAGKYPQAIHAAGHDPIYVGRLRRDSSVPHGLAMWIVADNLRKGAALNAVQIAEELIRSA